MNNWYVEMDLVCANKVKTNFMISARYISMGISGIVLFPMSDRFGRRKTLLVTWIISTMAQFILLYAQSYEMRLMGHIIAGMTTLK